MFGLIFAVAAATTNIPFVLVDNRIIVQATLDGHPGFSMIFDTGASDILITPQVARRLRLAPRRAGAISGAGAGHLQSSRARLRDVALGAHDIGSGRVIVASLEPIRRALHFPKLDGVVGYRIAAPQYLRVDMDRRLLTISSRPIAAPAQAHVVPVAIRQGLIHVDAAVDGLHDTAVIDTGDRSAFTLFQPFAIRNGFYGITAAQRNVVTGYGIGGPIRSNVIHSFLNVFGFALPDVVTRLPLGDAGVFSSQMEAGSIGNAVLKRFNIIYDAPHARLAVWPARDFAQDEPAPAPTPEPVLARHALFGGVLADKASGTTVLRVVPGSAAERARIASGDVVTKLDGVPTPTVASFLATMHGLRAGQNVVVSFVRNGAAQNRNVVLGAPADENDPTVTTMYGSVEVDGSLRRTLVTVPKNAGGRLPALLVLGGIGCYSVDVAGFPQDPYMHLTHDVTRAGFVTMRLEKSGVGDSQGPPCHDVDLAAEERGYAAALTALKQDPHVDPSRVYLFGHSIGTIEAPRLAAAQPVAGIIVAEAVGRDWPEYEVRNTRRQLELGGASPADVDAALSEKQECLVRLLLEKQREDEIERLMPSCKTHNAVYPVAASYMQQVAAINAIDSWSKLHVPVLAIYGRSDFVTEESDHHRLVDVINAHRPGNATFRAIDGMDHLLYTAPSPKAALDAFSKGTPRRYDSELSAVVVEWLRAALK